MQPDAREVGRRRGELSGRSALVTGAANGIGRAIARAFAEAGGKVLLADIERAAAEEAAAEIGAAALACECDVTQAASARAAVEAAVAAFGKLDIVVSNAAVLSPLVTVEEMREEDWRRALDVNLTGAFNVCKPAIPRLREAGGGAVILIASQMARVVNPGQTAYCATKGALVQLAKGMAVDHAKDGIRVNTLSPGGIATDRLARRFGSLEEAERVWGPKHPLGRLGRPEEIARAAVFLASDASSFMTGSDLLVDGGYTAW
jgi:NAD(P)-dependent dehydrogenase (short-subunit alcohol dehydrogenase family)